MQHSKAIESFHLLGDEIRNFLNGTSAKQDEWNQVLLLAEQENTWFTKENIILALDNISQWLDRGLLTNWLSDYSYQLSAISHQPFIIGVIMAGNIPLVGFHDLLCVLLSGNILHAKLSNSDKRLLPFISKLLIEIEPEWRDWIYFIFNSQFSILHLDAIIATGSNNTARHFEYYFRNIPHIIRKNRNGIAILDGKETPEELTALGKDIFSYFGLGCRNVSKLYVPKGYNFDKFFRAIEVYGKVINHNKYHSNYVYNRTIYLMDGKKFTDNGFLVVIENTHLSSPIAVLNYEEYEEMGKVIHELNEIAGQIQCVVCHIIALSEEFGRSQSPGLMDYADNVDVMKFLSELK